MRPDTAGASMTQNKRQATGSRAVPLVGAGAFLLLGLLTLDWYGVSWDEPLHREWGRIVWAYVLSGNSDLLGELAGGGQFYGPLFYILNYGVSRVAQSLGMYMGAANHLLTLVTASIGVLCTGALAQASWGRRAAVGAVVLLCVMPPFLAHAHYNPKDVPLLTLVAAAMLFATHAYRGGRQRDAVLCGVFLGCAIAIKPTALVIVPVVCGAIAADLVARRGANTRETLRLMVITAAASLVSLVVSWPTLWRQPRLLLGSIRYFASGSFWDGTVLYMGQLTKAAELPWHYTPVMLAMAFPLATLLIAAAGAGVVARRAMKRVAVFDTTLLLLWIALPLAMFMKPGLARYDGMRQLFFLVPAIAILGGVGWAALWEFGRRSRVGTRVVAAASIVTAGWLAAEAVRVFPYGGSYVSDGARVMLGPHLERRFELEYWGVTYREGMRWLQRSATRDAVVCVPVASQILPWHQVLLWQRETSREDLTYDCARNPRYVMLMTRFAEWPPEYERYRSRPPVFTISRLGSDLLYVYDTR